MSAILAEIQDECATFIVCDSFPSVPITHTYYFLLHSLCAVSDTGYIIRIYSPLFSHNP